MKFPGNILQIHDLKPDMMGFIFYPASKRFVGEQFQLPIPVNSNVKTVGVFVNEPLERVLDKVNHYRLDFAQLHGNESPDMCSKIREAGCGVIKAFGVEESFDFSNVRAYLQVTDLFLFDTQTPQHGGSGTKFNWKILNSYSLEVPFLLSGGIQAGDLEELRDFNHPKCAGIDVNSGFETAPGLKDADVLAHFIMEFRK